VNPKGVIKISFKREGPSGQIDSIESKYRQSYLTYVTSGVGTFFPKALGFLHVPD